MLDTPTEGEFLEGRSQALVLSKGSPGDADTQAGVTPKPSKHCFLY